MNKLLQTTLIAAIMATSGFTSEQDGSLSGEHNQNGNYNLKSDYIIQPTGKLNMQSGSITISSEKVLTNKGIIDISSISNFSEYSGQIQNENGSSIVIPMKSTEVIPGNNELVCDGSYKLTYIAEGVGLHVIGKEVKIQPTDGMYTDASEASTKLGLSFGGTVTMNPQGNLPMSMNDVIAHAENKAENKDKTFDIGQEGLSSREITLDSDKTIHFGLVGANNKNINAAGNHKLTISGDCSGMMGKIVTEGDLTFENTGSKGGLEVQGKLSYLANTETTVNGSMKVGSLFISQNAKLTVNSSIIIGRDIFASVVYGYNYPWVMEWTPGGSTTIDAENNPLSTPINHDAVIASMIISDGSDGWDSGKIHDSIFSYQKDYNGVYTRTHSFPIDSTGKDLTSFPLTVTNAQLDYVKNVNGTVKYENHKYLFTGSYTYDYGNGTGEQTANETDLDLRVEGNSETGFFTNRSSMWSGQESRLTGAIFGEY